MGRVADTRNEKRTDLSIEKTTLQNRHAASNSWKSIEKIPVWLQSSHTHTYTQTHTVDYCEALRLYVFSSISEEEKKKFGSFNWFLRSARVDFVVVVIMMDLSEVFLWYMEAERRGWGQWRISTNIQAPLIFSILCGSVALPLLAENSSHCVSYKKQKATDHKASLADVILL